MKKVMLIKNNDLGPLPPTLYDNVYEVRWSQKEAAYK
jgi:hypothetical protein